MLPAFLPAAVSACRYRHTCLLPEPAVFTTACLLPACLGYLPPHRFWSTTWVGLPCTCWVSAAWMPPPPACRFWITFTVADSPFLWIFCVLPLQGSACYEHIVMGLRSFSAWIMDAVLCTGAVDSAFSGIPPYTVFCLPAFCTILLLYRSRSAVSCRWACRWSAQILPPLLPAVSGFHQVIIPLPLPAWVFLPFLPAWMHLPAACLLPACRFIMGAAWVCHLP